MKKEYISNLRVLATFSVILLHTAADFVLRFGEMPLNVWHVANLWDAITRFCVPVFVMISGAVLLGRDEDLGAFMRKRLNRIIIPFLFWSIVYVVYYNYSWLFRYSILSTAKLTIIEVFKGAAVHLWYLFMIIGIYLFIPIIRKWTIVFKENEIRFFLVMWMVTVLVSFFNVELLKKFNLIYFSSFLGYLILGYYLDKIALVNIRLWLWVSVALIVVGFLATFIFTYHASLTGNEFVSKYYGYLTPNVILTAIGVFLLFRLRFTKTSNIVLSMDKHSFGIYFIHIIVLTTLKQLVDSESFLFNPFMLGLYIIGLALSTLVISYIIVLLLDKIPFLRKLIG